MGPFQQARPAAAPELPVPGFGAMVGHGDDDRAGAVRARSRGGVQPPAARRRAAVPGAVAAPDPGLLGDQVVVDSTRAWLLLEHGRLPRYYFPEADIRPGLLVANGRSSRSALKGETRH